MATLDPGRGGDAEPARRLTFDRIQAARRRSSLALFSLLAVFYFVAFAVIWFTLRFGFLLWTRGLLLGSGRIFPELAAVFIVACLAALAHWLEAVAGGVDRIVDSLGAVAADPEDRYHRILIDVAEEMKLAAGLDRTAVKVLPVMAMNAFSVTDLSGRAVIGVTEGALSRLNRRQIQAVVAHEAAHIREGDALVVTMACSLFAVFAQILAGLRSMAERDRRADILYPLVWLLAMGAYFLNVAVSRHREFLADAVAVELTRDPISLAEALFKIGRRWRGQGAIREELAPIFIVNPAGNRLDEQEGLLADLFSTHPPLLKRIRVLLDMAHTGYAALMERLKESEPVVRVQDADRSGGQRWMAYDSGEWRGPFALRELAGQAWFGPATWVAAQGSKEVVAAGAVAALAGICGALASESRSGCCPACRAPLAELEYEGISVRRCRSCRGMLVRQGQDFRILNRTEETFSGAQQAKAEEFRLQRSLRPKATEAPLLGGYSCPDCGGSMRRQLYNYQYFIEVDRCARCRLTWFDPDELEILQILVEKARP